MAVSKADATGASKDPLADFFGAIVGEDTGAANEPPLSDELIVLVDEPLDDPENDVEFVDAATGAEKDPPGEVFGAEVEFDDEDACWEPFAMTATRAIVRNDNNFMATHVTCEISYSLLQYVLEKNHVERLTVEGEKMEGQRPL